MMLKHARLLIVQDLFAQVVTGRKEVARGHHAMQHRQHAASTENLDMPPITWRYVVIVMGEPISLSIKVTTIPLLFWVQYLY